MTKRAVLIAGPTASGKSGFAMSLAKKINGAIINADSMQVYDGLRVLTARPSTSDEESLPHHLYGHVAPTTRYSVGEWLRAVERILPKIEKVGQIPIFVGGTGLYFKALTEGLSALPEFPPEQFNNFVANHADQSIQTLQEKLFSSDPSAATRIERGDRQRTLRALMVLELTGQSLSSWQRHAAANSILPVQQTIRIVLMPSDRAWLYQRIDKRFLQMVHDEGGAAEAHDLLSQKISQDLPLMKAIGVPHFYERSVPITATEFEEVISLSQRDTRRYAKRQMTWFRNQMGDWPRLDPMSWQDAPDKMLKDLDQIAQELEKQG
ncbi:MAG: tRNA (adenosine(37)-N6)-dimethylallyltransferase MiaA [Hyphomicrobiales bacterium]